jgi:hypothetical protein
MDLVRSAAPGLALSSLLFGALAMTHYLLGEFTTPSPLLYLLVMSFFGGLFYAAAFLLIPIPALRSEVARWREKLGMILARKALP